MQVLGLILIGIVIGVVARLVLPGRQHIGMLMTILLGIAGAVIGGVIASAIGEGDIWELNLVGTLVGIVAAVLLIALAERLTAGGATTAAAATPAGPARAGGRRRRRAR